MPCDETERDRLDILHTMFTNVRNKKLLNAPFQQKPPNPGSPRSQVLDLGCGTGIWLLDMAQKYEDTDFVGVDIANMGPEHVLKNVSFLWPWDYQSPVWTLGEKSWDIIHLQQGLGSTWTAPGEHYGSWASLYTKVLDHLIPGTGWFEQVEIDLTPRCDDGSLPANSWLERWYTDLRNASASASRSIEYTSNIGRLLHEAGFTDIREEVHQLPLNGHWATDQTTRKVGLWYHTSLGEGHNKTGGYGLEAMSLWPLTKFYNWPVSHVQRFCSDAYAEVSNPKIHAYHRLHVWSARAPFENEPR